MVYIDGQWENIQTKEDVFDVCREKIGLEFAYEVLGVMCLDDELDELRSQVFELESENGKLEGEITGLENKNDDLCNEIERLKEEIEKLKEEDK